MNTALQTRPAQAIQSAQLITGDIFSRWVEFLDASPKTVETYTRAIRQFLAFVSMNGITQPTREDVLAFREELKASGHKPTTVQNYITATRLFFRWTEQEGIYPNIADRVKGAKLDREHKKDYLTSAQVKEVIKSIDRDSPQGARDYAILTLMVTGGLRDIEVSRADIGDLRTAGDSVVLYVQGKGREEKTEYVKISAPVEKAIRAYLKERGNAEPGEPLFTSLSNNSKGQDRKSVV